MAKRDKEYKQPLKELTQEEIEKIFSEDNPEPDFSEEYKKKMEPLLKQTKKAKKNIKTICIIAVAAVSISLISWHIPAVRKIALKFMSNDMENTTAVVKQKNEDISADCVKYSYKPQLDNSFSIVREEFGDKEYTLWLKTAEGKDILYKQIFVQPAMTLQDECFDVKVLECEKDTLYISRDNESFIHFNWANFSGSFFIQGNASENTLLHIYDSLKREALP